jgi:hypothetical protein
MGGDSGMFPGDEATKQKQLRAEEEARGNKKTAYHYGGAAPAVEPSTFKSEDYHKYWQLDKHMHQTGNLGGDKGMWPGDSQVKEQQKRASLANLPLKTLFKQRKNLDGTVNRGASALEVYAGDQLVIAATANDIFGGDLDKYWGWITTPEYGKRVVAEIREKGLDHVGKWLTKSAQELPPMGEDPLAEAPMEEGAPMAEEEPMAEEGLEVEESNPKAALDDALATIESSLSDARDALSQLGGGEEVDINLNLGGDDEEGEAEEMELMASNILKELRIVVADAVESADELAMLSETFEGYQKLSPQQQSQLMGLSRDALTDSSTIVGESNTLVNMAKMVSNSMTKTSQYIETAPAQSEAATETAPAAEATPASEPALSEELVANAMKLRKQRRADLLKKAEESLPWEKKEEEGEEAEGDEKENEAHDGIGMKENAPVAGVATDTAESVANKAPTGGDHKPAPSKGNQDAKQHAGYSGTPSRGVAEKSSPADDGATSAADDAVAAADDATSEAEDETVQAKLTESFMNKKAEEEREAYKVKLRRAYDVAMDMQRKGLLAPTKPTLDRQVDELMDFDDKAFEAFKRSIAMAQKVTNVKTASDAGVLNVGVREDSQESGETRTPSRPTAKSLSDALWGE